MFIQARTHTYAHTCMHSALLQSHTHKLYRGKHASSASMPNAHSSTSFPHRATPPPPTGHLHHRPRMASQSGDNERASERAGETVRKRERGERREEKGEERGVRRGLWFSCSTSLVCGSLLRLCFKASSHHINTTFLKQPELEF